MPSEAMLEAFDIEHSALVRLGHRIGPDALQAVLEELGGGRIYLPRADTFWRSLERDMRDAAIRARFRGNNYVELAQAFGLTERWVRRIVHQERVVKCLGTSEHPEQGRIRG